MAVAALQGADWAWARMRVLFHGCRSKLTRLTTPVVGLSPDAAAAYLDPSKLWACRIFSYANMPCVTLSKPFQAEFYAGMSKSSKCPFAFYYDPFYPGQVRLFIQLLHTLRTKTYGCYEQLFAADKWDYSELALAQNFIDSLSDEEVELLPSTV
eukprot:9478463-Pyramimonas_sp.AAC.1